MLKTRELVSYPYIPGERGIQMSQLFGRLHNGEAQGTLQTGSGRELRFFGNSFLFNIRDNNVPSNYFMSAVCEGRIISFNLRTVIDLLDSTGVKIRLRHPDMYAGKFVGSALDYFESCGNNISVCKSVWLPPGSDNYDIFMKAFQKTGDKLQAAKATIDAGILAKYGFHNIDEEGILMEPLSEINGFKIKASFARF